MAQLAVATGSAAVHSCCRVRTRVCRQQVVLLEVPGPHSVSAALVAIRGAALAASRGAVAAGSWRAPHARGRAHPHQSSAMKGKTAVPGWSRASSPLQRRKLQALREGRWRSHRCMNLLMLTECERCIGIRIRQRNKCLQRAFARHLFGSQVGPS